MAPQRIDDAAIDVEIQGEYDRDDLLQNLVDAGYERVDMVERRGHFSVRGDITNRATALCSINRKHHVVVRKACHDFSFTVVALTSVP